MTNLSKELCEICGIEPKRVRPFQCDKNKDNIPCEFCIEQHGKCVSQREVYPDFEQAENFVKLLELKIKTKKREATLCEILHLEYGFANVLDFLKYLKSHLAGTIYFSGSYIFSNREQIMQAIRAEEWKYE